MKDGKISLGELIEQYRWYVGGFLLGLVVASFGFLLYQRDRSASGTDTKIAMLESRIEELEKARAAMVSSTPVLTPNKEQSESGQVKAVATTAEPKSETAVSSQAASTQKPESIVSGKVNLNTASVTELDSLSGIGPTYAQRIVEYREANGGFKSVDEVTNVKGIGPKTFEKFKDKITVE